MLRYTFLCVFHILLLEPTACSEYEARKISEGLLFGISTSSYQIEGATHLDGKSQNIWDQLIQVEPTYIIDNSTADIAADSYHKYKRDVEMLRELGVDYYRFSLSWTRLLPTSFPEEINQDGVQYYNNLINELLKYNIQPMITLYHWDLPQKLQEMGGWINPDIINWYADYARTAFQLFGDRVKMWITMNGPQIVCLYGYGEKKVAPRLNFTGFGEYTCSRHLLLAHARAYRIYYEEFQPTQLGEVGITIDAPNYEPATDSEEDIEATELYHFFTWQQYAHPIFSETGDYPPAVKKRVAEKSEAQGYRRTRLPEFTSEEKQLLKGSADFFGLNHYTTNLVTKNVSQEEYDIPSLMDDLGALGFQLDEWKLNDNGGTKFVPWGFNRILKRIREYYNNPKVYVTENGYGSYDDSMDDDDRITYYRGYIDSMLDAIEEGSNIRGYTAWSLMDNWEWVLGYLSRYGLYKVDFSDHDRARTPRKSAFVYKEILRPRTFDPNFQPNTTTMIIDEGH